ncbi:MAG: hypothetical protein HFG24_08510 [Anaerotruncus sp.]|nr:hypothetical protein [Anaerotruncus sp.]
MSDGKKYALSYDIQEEIQQQAESADVSAPCEHTDTGRVRCATQYGLYEVEVKKPPCINKIRNRFLGRQPAWAGMFFLTAAAERAILIRVRNHILFLRCCFYNKKR